MSLRDATTIDFILVRLFFRRLMIPLKKLKINLCKVTYTLLWFKIGINFIIETPKLQASLPKKIII